MYTITAKIKVDNEEKIMMFNTPVKDEYYLRVVLPENQELLEIISIEEIYNPPKRDIQGFLDSMVDIYPILMQNNTPILTMTVGILTEIIYTDLKIWLIKEPNDKDIGNMSYKCNLLLEHLDQSLALEIREKLSHYNII